MKKWIAILMAAVMALTLAACGAGEETTLTGMVVAVDGTKISLMEMDTANMGGMNFPEGERPEMPEGMEDFGGFNPEDFDGTMPDGENFPQWGEGEMPDMSNMPEMPEGVTRPERGEKPDFSGEMGDKMPDFGNFTADVETRELDIANVHISVEDDGVKTSGSLEDIKEGTMVTVTLNGKGEVTYVLVTSQFGFGGRFAN